LLAAARPEAAGQVYNLGDERVVDLHELAQLLVDAHPGSYRLVPFPPDRKAIDIGDYYADFAKIRRDLGWQPSVSLEDGLRRSIDFYREHGAQYWNDGH
jgi:nucleoside-diphosphate-sugar epimerase